MFKFTYYINISQPFRFRKTCADVFPENALYTETAFLCLFYRQQIC